MTHLRRFNIHCWKWNFHMQMFSLLCSSVSYCAPLSIKMQPHFLRCLRVHAWLLDHATPQPLHSFDEPCPGQGQSQRSCWSGSLCGTPRTGIRHRAEQLHGMKFSLVWSVSVAVIWSESDQATHQHTSSDVKTGICKSKLLSHVFPLFSRLISIPWTSMTPKQMSRKCCRLLPNTAKWT